MINDTLITLLFEFLQLLTTFDNIEAFNDFVVKLLALIAGFVSYIPTIKNYLGLVFFFIPKDIVLPMVEISGLALLVRIAVAIKKLIV